MLTLIQDAGRYGERRIFAPARFLIRQGLSDWSPSDSSSNAYSLSAPYQAYLQMIRDKMPRTTQSIV